MGWSHPERTQSSREHLFGSRISITAGGARSGYFNRQSENTASICSPASKFMALDPKDVTVYENNHLDLRTVGFKIVEVCLDMHVLGQHYVRYQDEGEFIKCPRGENCSGWSCTETQKAFESLGDSSI